MCEIWIPWRSFLPESIHHGFGDCLYCVPSDYQIEGAKWYYTEHTKIIPYFDKMKQSVQRLHGRNYYQVVGSQGAPLSKVCIFIANENSNGDISGGTRSAVLIAREKKIPTYNLRDAVQREKLFKLIGVEQ
jgi:hypothetical protein